MLTLDELEMSYHQFTLDLKLTRYLGGAVSVVPGTTCYNVLSDSDFSLHGAEWDKKPTICLQSVSIFTFLINTYHIDLCR